MVKSILLIIAWGLLGSIALSAQTVKKVSIESIVNRIVFKNAGTVTRDMAFKKVTKNSFYIETDEEYYLRKKYDYLFEVKDGMEINTPSGIRSSVPLGGLGAGTIELRGDGRLMDWNIFNNSPATGNEKVQLNDAFMGLWVQEKGKHAVATTIRTQAPEGLPSIQQIEYSGAFPVSKLKLTDSEIALTSNLYAYSEFHIRQSKQSATPCVLFSLELENPTNKTCEAAFLFNLPNYIKGQFNLEKGLVLTKDGNEPDSGNMSLLAEGADEVTYQTADNLASIWKTFSQSGQLSGQIINSEGAFGAISAKAKLAPGETRMVTIALAWYFPERPLAVNIIGNYYTQLYQSSFDVATQALQRLPQTWQGIEEWNQTCFDNSLPEWLQDAMVNSVATMYKTGIWTKDGRFRQWESFSCSNIDPIHIHLARILPYQLFFPEFEQGILRAFAAAQLEDGYIPEKLWPRGSNCTLDNPSPGRILGDCSSAFVLSVYMTYKWGGDIDFVDELWPNVKKAAEWQIHRSQLFGLPNRLASTYDLSGFGEKDLVSYNAFMHIASLQATIELAKMNRDEEFVSICEKNLELSRGALKKYLWTGSYFRNWWSKDKEVNNDIHVDSQYGQVWSYLLGLGNTTNPDLMRAHLQAEEKMADSPFGLQVFSKDKKEKDFVGADINQTVWQSGSIDWTILSLYLNRDVEKGLSQAKKLINNWRLALNDQWNYTDLTAVADGYPHTNSHYARQLLLWGIPLALIGQDYSAETGRLILNPKMEAPYRLPFFTPCANGLLVAEPGKPLKLQLISGQIRIRELLVEGKVLAKNIAIKTGETIVLDEF